MAKGDTTRARLKALRAQMKRHGLAAYYIPSTDQHQSEYVPSCWQRRAWLSGFTGSAGELVVLGRSAGLWTDGRYFLQAAEQLEGTGISLFKLGLEGTPSIGEHLARSLSRGQKVGFDPRLLSRPSGNALREALKRRGVLLHPVEDNLVDRIWSDQPGLPTDPVEIYPARFAGEPVRSKLNRLRKAMKDVGADAHVLSALDCIAWLFNIRGSDVPYNPVVISSAIITQKKARLFIDPAKLSPKVHRALGSQIRISPYAEFGAALARLGQKAKKSVWLDEQTVDLWTAGKIRRAKAIYRPSPIWRMKATKNATEIAGMKRAHVRDGVAMVKFLCWLDAAIEKGEKVTEIGASDQLRALRAEGEHFRGESFAPISGYAGHGAIVHYSATPESDARLRRRGLFLIDSGGQYLDGTTDITRTVSLGQRPTREQRDRFTRVLKGHIALARARFPAGTAGRQIDALARMPLWQDGLDYAHGTGHGVGCYLNVHEGPQAINHTRCTGAPLETGNVLSNEPGFYAEGKYGIRIENLVLVRTDPAPANGKKFHRFEELTLCPIDLRLIDVARLDKDERAWINAYHKRVRRELAPLLDAPVARWLRKATRAL